MSALTKDLALNLQKTFFMEFSKNVIAKRVGNKANKQENKLTNIQTKRGKNAKLGSFNEHLELFARRWLLLTLAVVGVFVVVVVVAEDAVFVAIAVVAVAAVVVIVVTCQTKFCHRKYNY